MTYRDIFIGSNTRDASDLDATADLSLMNNTTANSLSIASNGKLYLGGNPNQRAVQLVLTGNNGRRGRPLASGAPDPPYGKGVNSARRSPGPP